VEKDRQSYRDYLDECKGGKGDLHFEGSEGGTYPSVVIFRDKPDIEDIQAAFVLDRVEEDFVVFVGLRDMRVKSVAVPFECLIVVKEAPMDTGSANALPPSEQ
jgi:hypothetical protein